MSERVSDIFQAKPRWGWTGVAELDFLGQNSHVDALVAMLPAKKSSDAQIVAYLIDLRARFHRWLHQDEFGPNRRQQTASLRALTSSFGKLQRHLIKSSSLQKEWLDAMLRSLTDPPSQVLEALYEAAADVERALQISGAPIWKAMWASRLRDRVETLMMQLDLLDTNTDGEILLVTLRQNFDRSKATGLNLGLVDVERWLNTYWNVLAETLNELNERRGAEERVSLKLLVEQLCEFWERETGRRVTAHGQLKDVYTQRAETKAGRFVTAAVEAMLPDPSWFEEHAEFAHSSRAKTFLPDDQGHREQRDRARQILVIMRDFVKRRPKLAT